MKTREQAWVGNKDVNFATGGSGAAEEWKRENTTGGETTLERIDASHIKFRSVSGSLDDLVDGGADVSLSVNDLAVADDLTVTGDVTFAAMSSAGYVKNTAAGVLSGGNAIAAGDLPTAIDAAKIADGSVSNAEFQYLNGVTSAIQTQLSAKVPAVQAEMEAATEAVKYVTPAVLKYHPGVAKFWVKWVNDGSVLASYNVDSVTDVDVAKWTVIITTDFSAANYVVAGMSKYSAAGAETGLRGIHVESVASNEAVGQIQIHGGDGAGNSDNIWNYIVGFGDQ